MKNLIIIIKAALIGSFVFLISTTNVKAQDWNGFNPNGVETLVDTTLLRAVVVTIAPGEKIGPVTHPAHFAYFLADGKIKVYPHQGESFEFDLKAGTSLYSDPEGPHYTENIGEAPVKFLLVELKEYPYKEN